MLDLLKHNNIMNKLSVEEKTKIIGAQVEGNSIRAVCRMTNHSKGAVLKLLVEVGQAYLKFQDDKLRNIRSRRVHCDEIWSKGYSIDSTRPYILWFCFFMLRTDLIML